MSASRTLFELLRGWLHLAVLWTLAIAQPLLGILAEEPAFFVARDNTNGDIVAVALILTLAPPTVMVVIEALVCRAYRVWDVVHLTFVAGLASVLILQVVSDLGGPGALVLGLAGLGGVLFALAYRAFDPVSSVLSVLAPVPVLVIAWFLFVSPVSDLLFPESEGAAASTKRPLASAPPIVLIVFDEFFGGAITDTRGRIDKTRYPNFADLAAHSTWYRNASTVSGRTTNAVPSVMTGTYPIGDPLPTAGDHPNSIFTLLANHYSMDVTEPVTSVCPRAICTDRGFRASTGTRWRSLASDLAVVGLHTVLPEGLRSRLPAVDRSFGDFRGQGRDTATDSDVNQAASETSRKEAWERFVADLEPPAARPAFHFYHSLLPHVPWQYLPSGKQYAVVGPDVPGLTNEEWANDQAVVNGGQQRFLLQVGFVDKQIGQLLRQLRQTGLFDRSLVVITADHGVSFRQGLPRRELALDRPADIASVPLFVKLPNQEKPRVDDSPVRTIDVVPTIADLLGVTPAWKVDGQSFLNGTARSARGLFPFVGGAQFTFAQLVRSRNEAVGEMIDRFGERDGGAGIFASGSNKGLLGRTVVAGDLPLRSGAEIQLDQASLLRNVDLASSVLPVFLAGSVAGADAHERVAVVVNDRISATTTTFSDTGAVRFAVTVSPRSLRQGSNSVTLVALEGGGDSPRLVELGTAAQENFELVERDGRQLILDSSGKEIPVQDDAARGYVDGVDLSTAVVTGWAVDPRAKEAADDVLVFAGDRFLSEAPAERPRPDLAEPVGAWATTAGFHVTIPAEGVDEDEVRVFAVVNGQASEL